ncbi:hypothetical protein GW846_01450 [Candidatus Gracilibacteria bacterium]|nr:hypothetical protein [Candidatus Gracilibacteria bacterium]
MNKTLVPGEINTKANVSDIIDILHFHIIMLNHESSDISKSGRKITSLISKILSFKLGDELKETETNQIVEEELFCREVIELFEPLFNYRGYTLEESNEIVELYNKYLNYYHTRFPEKKGYHYFSAKNPNRTLAQSSGGKLQYHDLSDTGKLEEI